MFAYFDAVSWLSSIVRVGGWIALSLVVFGVVRRHRPDAWHSMRAWAIAGLLLNVMTTAGWRYLIAKSSSDEGASLLTMNLALTIADTVAEVVVVILLIRGLVAIAQPPKPPAPIEAPPYR